MVLRRTLGFLAAHGCSDFLFNKASLTYPPAALFSAHKKEEKWKVPAGSFLSRPGEEEKITLKVKQSKPPTGYMTPSLHTSFRKEISLRLL